MSQRRRSSRSSSPRAGSAPRLQPAESPSVAAVPGPLPLGWWAAAVFAVAFLVRLAVGAQLADEPLFRSPQLDSLQYYLWAQRIAMGDFLWPVPPPHGLGYPVFLGALLALLDGSLGAVRVAQSLLGAGTCALAAAVASRAFGRPAGLAAGLLLALYGPLAWIDVSLLAEGLLLFLLVLALWIVSRGDRPLVRAALAGLVIALATLVRPTAVALLPALVAALVLGRPRDRRVWGAAGLLLATFFLVAAPVVWKISQTNGAFVPVQGHSGFAFYIGNHPDGDGLPSPRIGRGWEEIESEALRAGIEDPAAQDQYYRTRALAAMRERPGDSLGLFASKAFWLVQAAEVRDSHSFEFFRARSGLLQVLPRFGLLFALAAAGIAAVAGRSSLRLPSLPIVLGLAGFAAVTVLTMVGTRYRMPLIPFLAILAGPAVALAVEAVKARQWRRLAVPAAVLVLAWRITHIRSYPPSLNFAEELAMSGSSLEKQEDWTGALAAFEEALAADPGYVPALEGIGRTRIKQNDFRGAEEVLRRALQIKPDSQRAHLYLGVVLAQTGRPDEAVQELRASLARSPNDLQTLEALAPLLLARGEVDESAAAYRRLLAIKPNDAAAHLAVARLAGARNDPAAGLPSARRAVELAPQNPEAWLVLARLAIDARDAATAESALQRVDAMIGRSHPLVAQSWEMLYRLQGR